MLPQEILGSPAAEEQMAARQSQQGASSVSVERGGQNRRGERLSTAITIDHLLSPPHKSSRKEGIVITSVS